MINLLGLRSFK